MKGECFKLLGRPYYVNDVPCFTWSNSGIEFSGKFDRLTVFFGENKVETPVMFKVYIDNLEYKASVVGKGVTAVIENLRDKVHNGGYPSYRRQLKRRYGYRGFS